MGRAKLVDYLLNPNHPKGGSKARFLIGLGFSAVDPDALAAALADHFERAPHARAIVDDAGSQRLICEGPIRGLDTREPWIRSVWVVDPGRYASSDDRAEAAESRRDHDVTASSPIRFAAFAGA